MSRKCGFVFVFGFFVPYQMITSPFICSFLHIRMQFSLKSECVTAVAEMDPLHSACEERLFTAAQSSARTVLSITVTDLLEPCALSFLDSCGEKNKPLRRMWHFHKRINSGALPCCTAEMFEFTDVSLLYLTH